jgi:RNA polymerase sigma-70 factor (sigma-E family)
MLGEPAGWRLPERERDRHFGLGCDGRQPFRWFMAYYRVRVAESASAGEVVVERPDFSEFVSARSTALLRTAYLLTGNEATAEDLLQATLVKCWRSWSRLTDQPEPYVHAVLVNTYLSWRRRRWHGETPSAELPEVAVQDGTGEVDERAAVWVALRRLPRRQRAVVVLRYFDDLSEAETARLLGISVGTVKSQSSKALAALRVDSDLAVDRPTREVQEHAVD